MDEMSIVISTAWAVLTVVARWLLFRKAGRPGWHSIVPILNAYDEYAICWRGGKVFLLALLVGAATVFGMVGQDNPVFFIGAAVAILWIFIIHWKQSMKLAAAFGKGPLYGLFLFLFDKRGRVGRGLSAADCVGKR